MPVGYAIYRIVILDNYVIADAERRVEVTDCDRRLKSKKFKNNTILQVSSITKFDGAHCYGVGTYSQQLFGSKVKVSNLRYIPHGHAQMAF